MVIFAKRHRFILAFFFGLLGAMVFHLLVFLPDTVKGRSAAEIAVISLLFSIPSAMITALFSLSCLHFHQFVIIMVAELVAVGIGMDFHRPDGWSLYKIPFFVLIGAFVGKTYNERQGKRT